MSSTNYITCESKKIYFELNQNNKRIKNLTIKVKPCGKVIVCAPNKISNTDIYRILNTKKEWIYNKVNYFKKYNDKFPKLDYKIGENHYYLGHKYNLEQVDSSIINYSIKISNNKILIPDIPEKNIKDQLYCWYKERAIEIFTERFNALLLETSWVKKRPKLVLKYMKSQWGSCSTSGKISLNIHLIKAPIKCIDYVIYHELCHVKVHNHSKAFYELLETVCSDWKLHRKTLKEISQLLINRT